MRKLATLTLTDAQVIDLSLKTAPAIKAIGNDMRGIFVDREDVITAMEVCLVGGIHALLLGDPGTGKTNMIEYFGESSELNFFTWMLGQNDGPEELFGQMSMKKMTEDQYVRMWTRLSTAHIALLDEPGKMSSNGQNMLLRALNERVGYDDEGKFFFPLQSVFAGSNELFTDNAAFIDRFLYWVPVRELTNANDVWKAITTDTKCTKFHPVNPDHMAIWRKASKLLRLKALQSQEIRDGFNAIYEKLKARGIKCSTRRFSDLLVASGANALMRGSAEIQVIDLLAFIPGVWKSPEQYPIVKQEIEGICNVRTSEVAKVREKINKLQADYAATKPTDAPKRASITTALVVVKSEIQDKTGSEWVALSQLCNDLIKKYTGN